MLLNVNGPPSVECVVRDLLERRLGVVMGPNLGTMARRRMDKGDVLLMHKLPSYGKAALLRTGMQNEKGS